MDLNSKLAALFPNVEINAEVIGKLGAILESTIEEQVEQRTKEIKEQADAFANQVKQEAEEEIRAISEKAEEYGEYVVEQMSTKVDEYAQFVVDQFINENKERLVESETYTRMKDVIASVKKVFEENYIQFDETSGAQKIRKDLQESVNRYNDLHKEFTDLKATIAKKERKDIFESITEGLSDTQKERLEKVASNGLFENIDSYKSGLALLVEEIKRSPSQENKTKEVISEGKTNVIPMTDTKIKMQEYLNKL